MNTSVLISNCRHVKSKAEVPNLINVNTRCTSRPVSSAMADAHTHVHAHTCAHTRTHTWRCAFLQNSLVAVSPLLMGLGGLNGRYQQPCPLCGTRPAERRRPRPRAVSLVPRYTVSKFPKGTPPGAPPPSRPRSLLLACGGTFFSPYGALRFPVKLHRRFGLIPPARPGLSAPVFYLLPISSKFAPSVSLNSQLFLRSHKPIKMLTMQCQQGCPSR